MNYDTITINRFMEFCIAFKDASGVETKKSLEEYEAKSEGTVDVIFVDSRKEAIELSKTF